ncbi:MAG: sodium/proton antiporter NhaB [Deferribacteraceae bacterium]|jgi:NhaB family Na+:H+ antiporter|nr:sodium/proton antiporter NhaB [Deferribacteraceae bacterium]
MQKNNGVIAAIVHNFMGQSPQWYKLAILGFLVVNPLLLVSIGKFWTGWIILAEFIFTLAMALKCYPLPPAGLLAFEAIIMRLTSVELVYEHVADNLPVILLLMFMVAGIHFLKSGLLFIFTKIIVSIRSKVMISLVFCFMGAILSAFLDALTVTAVIIAVAYGFYGIYHRYASNEKRKGERSSKVLADDSLLSEESKKDIVQFRGFLRNIMMHGAVGTALGGALTLVGEPQNLLIGKVMGWNFVKFFIMCAPVSIVVFFTGMLTCVLLEIVHFKGYGYKLPENVYNILKADVEVQNKALTTESIVKLAVQALVVVFLVAALAFHLAEVGLIGLTVIILATAFNGVSEEHHFGEAFKDALPFTALLVVFFAIVAVIHDQGLFKPILHLILGIEGHNQLIAFFLANGLLSAISDNVFVATVYITEIKSAFEAGMFDQNWYDKLAVAVNMGTNIPSVATPNGQAAFLFLLTSSLAPLIRLSYLEMVKLALPYTITMTSAGLLATIFLL